MSDEPSSQSPEAPHPWEPIPAYQRRVLGVLIEKQKTSKSADAYPMTLNSITTGSNQKSNRDPVYELDEVDIEETLNQLQRRGLVMRMTGGRVDRFRHLLYEAWKVSKVEMALLAELLLRGSQSEGDLRIRASRMEEIKDLDELRALLTGLAQRYFIVYVTAPDRRGTIVTHGFFAAEELDREKTRHASGSVENETAPRTSSTLEARLNEAFDEIAKLKDRVAKLEAQQPNR